ncbi:MAG: hypothetical protein FJ291_18375 [Planctomycetes bacterium]|nr:hypothetical protein [Planctomycetota bacterium]
MTPQGTTLQQSAMSADEVLSLFGAQAPEPEWSFNWCKPSDTGKWTHDYHRYPAKFIPQLAEGLFDEYIASDRAHVNDPFMGSGTTIATAISRGFQASGTDVNGIACLLTRVKATPLRPDFLDRKIERLMSALVFLDREVGLPFAGRPEPFIPEAHLDRINYWFPEQTRDELGRILRAIRDEEEASVREFFLVAFSHILKNCSIWLQGSTKPTRDPRKVPARPFGAFRKHLRKMQRGNDEFYSVVPALVRDHIRDYLNVRLGDARRQPVPDASVDLVVTSSPYVTSYEYADLHQLSTIWLDLADDLKAYKSAFIGTSQKSPNEAPLRSEIAEDIVSRMLRVDRKMSLEIRSFFADMQQVIDETFRVLRPGGRCCYVIGNTSLRGVEVLNAQVLAESMQSSGLLLDRVIVREIPLKILPQTRDKKTGKFASNEDADLEAYPTEYIVIGLKE